MSYSELRSTDSTSNVCDIWVHMRVSLGQKDRGLYYQEKKRKIYICARTCQGSAALKGIVEIFTFRANHSLDYTSHTEWTCKLRRTVPYFRRVFSLRLLWKLCDEAVKCSYPLHFAWSQYTPAAEEIIASLQCRSVVACFASIIYVFANAWVCM